MKIDPTESYDSVLEQIRNHELEFAKKQIQKGIPIEDVFELMSQRIIKKSLHPLIKSLQSKESTFDVDRSREEYNIIMKDHKMGNLDEKNLTNT